MRHLRLSIIVLTAVLVTFLTACGENNPTESDQPNVVADNNPTQNQPTNSQDPTVNQEADPPEPEDPDPEYQPLRLGPLAVEIGTEDGRLLEGYYYPAKTPDAPVIVLMHWAPGSMDDWEMIARWLQNRREEIGMLGTAPIILASSRSSQAADWTDHTWFPAMPEEVSFAVLVFNFGGYANSQGSRETWVIDAQSAITYAASLPEVNPHQIAALGASIGSDGVVDGCYLFNDLGEMGTCVGAFSLSPGNYLTDDFTYGEAVTMLDKEGHPVWCLAAEDDGESPAICLSSAGENYRSFIFPSNFHGMQLIVQHLYPLEPSLELDVLQLVQEWLEEVYQLSLNQINID